MPHERFDALERRCDACWERGQDPNIETDEDPEDSDKERGPVNVALEELHEHTIETLTRLISISRGAATALHDDQNIVDLESLWSLKDSYVKEIGQAIIKPTPGRQGHAFPVLSQAHLELLAFWARHLQHTSREPDDWLETKWAEIQRLGP